MNKPTFHLRSLIATLLVLLFAGHPVLADDTEVLLGRGKPNIVFILDTSSSMGTVDNPTTDSRSRLKIVQDVFAELMNEKKNYGINVALMRFDSGGHGGYFVSPMQELNDSTKGSIIAASNAFTPGGNTPLSETLYEAARFYGGRSVDFGDSSNPGTNHADVFTGSDYDSPITSQCQANNIVLLTDGVPTNDNEANNSIRTDFLGGTSCVDNCLDEVADYLHTTDQSSLSGDQFVDTFTIGFTTNQALLEATGLAGGGTAKATGGNTHYVNANNVADLKAAFESFIEMAADANDSFSPPALATNDFNGISHYNKLYYALFEPAAGPKWPGNVKPYSLDSNRNLIDANNNIAVDDKNMFKPGSQSYWASAPDGLNIADGGANGRLPAGAIRKLYTYTGSYDTDNFLPAPANLYEAANALENAGTSNLTPGMLGLLTSAELDTVLNIIRDGTPAVPASPGVPAKPAVPATLGAPLHSQPALVTYGGDAANPILTLFVATNDGFLHALDASPNKEGTVDGGRELFAFIPQELLPNLPDLANNTGTHPYGLDGDISVWVKDDNGDHTIQTSGSERVYVYVGMRRGGNNYYALDVTDREAPVLKWVIKGGGGPSGTTGFKELGQSWSKPSLATIEYGASTKKVLIFGGGYDTAQDANPLGTDDTIGRAIFIVDAETGERLWWAGPVGEGADFEKAGMFTNSIPSEVRLFDSDLDGNIDRLYVGDMRGQIFRLDIEGTTTGMSGTGILLASLGSDTDEANHRRFYYPPDVVVTKPKDAAKATYVSLNIGSGYRAHPLNPFTAAGVPLPTVDDRFYALLDPNVLGAAPSGFTTIVNSALTNNPTNSAALAASNGWYITLDAGKGEKVLAPSVTVDGVIYFTTYTPSASATGTSCVPPGVGRLYRVSLFDASPAGYLNKDGTVNTTDPDEILDRPGIPPAPVIVFSEDGEIFDCEGTECHPIDGGIKIESTYWRDS